MSSDPRDAKTLGEACQNPDGTFNGIRLMSWLSKLPVEECQKIADRVVEEKRNGKR